MDGFVSGSRYGGSDRRQEILSGESQAQFSGAGQEAPVPARSSRASRADVMGWSFGDNPDAKRKKRVYKYKVYSVEGKVKASLKKSLRWIKTKCSNIVRGH